MNRGPAEYHRKGIRYVIDTVEHILTPNAL